MPIYYNLYIINNETQQHIIPAIQHYGDHFPISVLSRSDDGSYTYKKSFIPFSSKFYDKSADPISEKSHIMSHEDVTLKFHMLPEYLKGGFLYSLHPLLVKPFINALINANKALMFDENGLSYKELGFESWPTSIKDFPLDPLFHSFLSDTERPPSFYQLKHRSLCRYASMGYMLRLANLNTLRCVYFFQENALHGFDIPLINRTDSVYSQYFYFCDLIFFLDNFGCFLSTALPPKSERVDISKYDDIKSLSELLLNNFKLAKNAS